MAQPMIGEIRMFGGNFAPRNWALCDGQLLAISSNEALFSILGTTYGGDGRTTFKLPDLRGRVSVHAGQGPGLSHRPLGQSSGQENVTLVVGQLPAHNHLVPTMTVEGSVNVGVNDNGGDTNNPANAVLTEHTNDDFSDDPPNQGQNLGGVSHNLATPPTNTAIAGANHSHNNMQPFQVVNYIIALIGLYPSRS